MVLTQNYEENKFYVFSSEFLFIIITFLISVNFINIVRPMPIWWDDLWVYMNFPNLIAASWKISNLWIIAWQSFTGIWYMLWSATQSFFLNNLWWVLSLLVLALSFWDLLNNNKKNYINLPLFAWAIFLSMPMIVFQQAKDMKLDPGLFFISWIIIYLVLYIFIKYIWYKDLSYDNWVELVEEHDKNEDNYSFKKFGKNFIFSYIAKYKNIWKTDLFETKTYLIYFLLIWILAWFAFTIKATTLLLISWILAIMFYSKLWVAWLLSYLAFYIWIFTKAWLWEMMFVIYPKDDIEFKNKVFIYSFVLALIFLSYSFKKYWAKALKNLLIIVSLFLFWIFIWAWVWFWKNISTLWWNITLWWILNWKWDAFNIDYTKIYSKEEIEKINKLNDTILTVNSSWTTTNEDMWRYFGYDKWINNYIKLPYNLTMQVNQRWEFTDITYIYLAIIPAILLFLSYKFELLSLWIFIFSLFPLILNYNNFLWKSISNLFASYTLPWGYIILALFFLLPSLYLIYTLNKDKLSVLFKLNLVFSFFYIFLWTISAFWIVWYWIAMYYSLLLVIMIWAKYIVSYNDFDSDKDKTIKLIWSWVFFILISFYFLFSSLPHWFNNFVGSSYNSYKANLTDNYTSIFDSHSDYFDALVELNISESKRIVLFNEIISKIKNPKLTELIKINNINNLNKLNSLFIEISTSDIKDSEIIKIKDEVKNLRSNLYKNILYPSKDIKNNLGIYRIWTFLKFFISDNHIRLLEDSMVTEFNKYIYSKDNPDISVDRMKKMGVNYFLVDLNAATIDRDPRHDLTSRFEKLLLTFVSDKLELVQTDSLCLKIAIEDYKKSKKTIDDLDKYIRLAWVNYEGYTNSGEVISRWMKQIACYNYILNLIKENKINDNNYNYLLPIASHINNAKFNSQEQLINFFTTYVSHWWMTLFKIKN